jgi:hypothetical protein
VRCRCGGARGGRAVEGGRGVGCTVEGGRGGGAVAGEVWGNDKVWVWALGCT